MVNILEVHNVSVAYQRHQKVLSNVSFSLPKGTISGIIGPNGAGKSTLLNAILNIIPHTGSATFDNVDLSRMAKRIAYVAQKSQIDLQFPITVEQTISLGLQPRLRLFQRLGKRQFRPEIEEILAKIQMADFADRQISQLSGGQLQRVMIGRCMIQQADLILLDEPFSGIDARSEATIMALLQELKQSGKTILMVHHDLNKVQDYFDHLVIIKQALVAAGSTHETFTPENMQQAYGLPIITKEETPHA